MRAVRFRRERPALLCGLTRSAAEFGLARCLAFIFSGLFLALPTITAQAQTVSVSPVSLNFGNLAFGSTSAIRKVTLTNTGSAALSITSIAASANFVETNTCHNSVSAGAKCVI